MGRVKEEKRIRAVRELERLRSTNSLSGSRKQDNLEAELKAAALLAEANEKTMTVEDARAWAVDFVTSHHDPEAIEWAWRFVGRVEVHQKSPRGPRPRAQTVVSDAYDPILKAVAKKHSVTSQKMSAQQSKQLLAEINRYCSNHLLAPLSASEMRVVAGRVLPVS